jgi:hypothetical protein
MFCKVTDFCSRLAYSLGTHKTRHEVYEKLDHEALIATVLCISCPSLLSLNQSVTKSPTMAGTGAAATGAGVTLTALIYIYCAANFE